MCKKSLSLVFALIMVFSFAGCNEKIDLEKYKKDAKSELSTYSHVLIYDLGGRHTYDYINGLGIYEILKIGESEIDGATNKKSVDNALYEAKNRFGAIPIWFETNIFDVRWNDACYTFGLKYFDPNVVFECSTNDGMFKVIGIGTALSEFSISYEDNHGSVWRQRAWDRVYWYPDDVFINETKQAYDGTKQAYDGTKQAFIDVVVKIDNQIVSYAVIEIVLYKTICGASLLGCAIPEKEGDGYKSLDEEEVKSSISRIKNEM